MHRYISRILIFSFLFLIFIQDSHADDRMQVFVSILPQKFFVQQIGKEFIDVHVMVEPGADPHTYEPKPKQMVTLSRAKLYFAIGIEFEKAKLEKIISINRGIKVVHMDHGIKKIRMPTLHGHEWKEGQTMSTGYTIDDDHQDPLTPDPHIWLSPPLVMLQSRSILNSLREMDPAHAIQYENNYKAFISRIVDLDLEFVRLFENSKNLHFMVFHPSWGYFAEAYGLIQVPVEIEGKEPSPSQLKELIEKARKEGIKMIFIQPQFSISKAELLAREIRGQVVLADPLAEDWLTNLMEVASKFRNALE